MRAQEVGLTEGRRAAPSSLVAGCAVVSAIRLLGVATSIAVIVLVPQGRGFPSTWWLFTLIALVLTVTGVLGAQRPGTAVRRARDPSV